MPCWNGMADFLPTAMAICEESPVMVAPKATMPYLCGGILAFGHIPPSAIGDTDLR